MKKYLHIVLILLMVACGKKDPVSSNNSYYTCPMHPSVRSDSPGSCPICGMDLVKKDVAAQSEHANIVHLTLRQEKRIGVRVDSIREGSITTELEFPGRVVTDPGSRRLMTSRIPGIITRLYFKEPLTSLKRGQPVFEIYSEILNSDLREYKTLLRNTVEDAENIHGRLVAAAKEKLLLWGLSDRQIDEAVRSGKDITNTFHSDWSGIVSGLFVSEGAYVVTGQEIIEISSLDRLWVEISGYPGENITGSAMVKNRMGDTAPGEVILKDPETGSGQRPRVYVSISNASSRFIPGQEVSVMLSPGERTTLLVPRRAIIPGRMEIAWIKTGRGMYEPRMVTTGQAANDSVEILSGLKPGDRLVTEGAYLINSEFILQQGAGAVHDH